MRHKHILIIVIVFQVLMVGGLCSRGLADEPLTKQDLVREAKAAIEEIDVAQAREMFEEGWVYFIDCREEKEFRRGHIPGALNIARGWLEFKIEEIVPERNATIVLYCRSGDRSSLGVLSLQRMGYVNSVNLKGGWRAWMNGDHPVE
ncbi:MAG: hypothetical protein D6E12_14125 [Desulfovibrio sp.]|nr:MAG: hypothetical protein D6E12_14125 [Desulfovibrio sp.]